MQVNTTGGNYYEKIIELARILKNDKDAYLDDYCILLEDENGNLCRAAYALNYISHDGSFSALPVTVWQYRLLACMQALKLL